MLNKTHILKYDEQLPAKPVRKDAHQILCLHAGGLIIAKHASTAVKKAALHTAAWFQGAEQHAHTAHKANSPGATPLLRPA
jgi:hypothetical protein